MEYIKEVLKSMGISERRIKMDYCTAAEGQKFAIDAAVFDKEIRELGPSPLRPKSDTKEKKKAKA